MEKTKTKAIFEGKMMGMDFTYGWMVQEKVDAYKNDKGIRNAPEMFQWCLDKDIIVTVQSSKTNETKTFKGKMVFDGFDWTIRGDRLHTCIEMFQWCIGHAVQVTVEVIPEEVQASS